MSQHPNNPSQVFTCWQHKIKWQMKQAEAVGDWARYRDLKRKLDANPRKARAALAAKLLKTKEM